MPTYSIQAPNGRTYSIEGPAGATQDEIIAEILRRDPSAGQPPKPVEEVGMLGRGMRGLESLLSSQRTAAESLGGGNEAAMRGVERGEAIQQKYPGMDDWEAVSKAYKEKGLPSAVGEYISRVPGALAEQAPQIAESAAAARLGAAAAGPYGGVAGAFAPSFTQQYGSFLERQADEQRKAGQPVDVNRLTAAAAALPAAMIDTAATYIPMGRGLVKSLLGEEVSKLLFKGATKEAELLAAKKLTSESFLKTVGKGTAIGAGVEIPGEVTQQMLERLQAGLPLFDQDALEEYGKTAFSTTMLAPMGAAGRYSEKSGARQLLQDEEDKKKREARRLEEEALNQKRQSPDYAKEVEQKLFALEQQRKDLKAQHIKIDENSPTVEADKLFNKDLDRKIAELGKNEIHPAAKEYMAVKPILDQIREQERLAAVAPEDVMMEHLGVKMPETKPSLPQPLRVDEFGRVTNEAPATEANPVQDYAAQQIQAARDSGQLTPTDLADYLMQDPAMAARVVKERPAVPGYTSKDLATIYGGVNLRLKEREKQGIQESKSELAQRQEDLKSQQLGPTVDQMDMFKSSEEQLDEQRRTGEYNFDFLDPIFEKAMEGKPSAVAVPADVKASDKAPAMRERISKLVAEADQADRDYRRARTLRERPAASEAFTRRSAALKQLDTLGTEGGAYAQNLIAARRAQEAALAQLEDTTQRLKADEVLGNQEQQKMASATRETLVARAEQYRAEFIKASLQEAALNRRAAGKQALTQDEAIKAASKLYDTVNDWVGRARVQRPREELTDAQKNLEPTRQKVQRNGNTVSTYKVYDPETQEPVELTIIRQKGGNVFRVFSRYPDGGGSEFDNSYGKGMTDKDIVQKSFLDTDMFTLGTEATPQLSEAEAKHFKARLEAVRNQLSEVPSEPTRVETLLKTQFATTEAQKVGEAKGETATTLAGELRRHSEHTLANLDKVLARTDLPQGGIYEGVERGQPYVYRVEDMRELLEKAYDTIAKSIKAQDFYDRVQEAIDRGDIKPAQAEKMLAQAEAEIVDKRNTRGLLDAVDAQIDHIMRGRHLEETLVKSRGILSEETVVDVVPGKEGSTRFGVKRKWGDVMKNKNLVPLSDYQQDIKDALAAAEPTAIEQKEAGQKALFPETEKDLGYIRMTPKNFANSPKIREAWEALDKARALAKKKADKEAIVANRSKAVATTISRLNDEIDRIKNDTKFFWTNTKQWTDYDLARAYVGYPEIGNNPEEQKLVDRYLADKGRGLTAEQKETVAELLRQFNSKKMPEYQKHLKEAMQILAQGGRLEDLDNQLLHTMQSANKSVRDQAAKLREDLSVMRTAIKQMRSISKNDRQDPLAKRINALEAKAEQAKGQYRERVEKLFTDARTKMDEALAEILDPDIKNVKADLDNALKTLEKEKAELERTEKKVQEILAQPEGQDRMQLATYQQFRYEEKKSIIEDLEQKIKDQQADLENLMDTRMNAHDTAAAVMQAVTDKKVQNLRDRIIDLETNVATLRGESVTAAEPGRGEELPTLKYPFAAQKAEMDLKAAKAELKGAERQQTETAQEIKSQARQLEDIWREMWGGFGKRRVEGRVETLSGTEQLRLDRLNTAAEEAMDRASEAEYRGQKRRAQIAQIDKDISDVISELAGVEHMPDDQTALRAIVEDETSSEEDVTDATAKLSMLQQLTELEAQREVAIEGKPARKQQAATVETTAKQAANKPFRTGDKEAKGEYNFQQMSREEQRAANEAAQAARGTKAAPEVVIKPTIPSRALDAGIILDEYDLTNSTSAQQAQLTDTAKEALRDGRLLDALDDVAINSKLPFIRENAAAMRKLLARTRVIVTDDIEVDGKQAPAAYNSTQNTILMHPEYLTEANLIHEAGHSATMRAMEGPEDKLNNDQYAAKQEIQQMFEDLTEDGTLSGEYAAKNAKEFISEVQSNAALREKLDNRSLLRKIFDALLRLVGVRPAATRTEQAQAIIERLYMQSGKIEAKTLPAGTAQYTNDEAREVGESIDKYVAKNRSTTEKVRAAAGGWLGLETQLVDRFAPLERISKTMDALKGSQMMYYLRMYDQRMHFVQQAVGNGALARTEKTRKDGQKEYVIESQPGASIKGVVQILKDAKQFVGNGEAVNRMFTAYMSAIRADNKGFQALSFAEGVTEADLRKAEKFVNSNPELKNIFEDARREYNDYNRGMVNFLADTGAISEQLRKELTQENDYIPWYRENGGVAELMIGNESRIRIGSIAEQPYLHELVGGDKPILDFMVSSVQNTNMLVDMGMRNLATKNAVFELMDLKMAKIIGATSGPDIVKFKEDGEDRYAQIEGTEGIPGDLIVKGMEGIPTQMPALFRMMSLPSRLLRKAVTLTPMYAAKQLFRDSLAAPIVSGADFKPVWGALKEINKPSKEILERRGVIGGQQFTGTNEDLSLILREITDGKPGWMSALAKAEAIGMEADSLTRRAQYNSYIEQGLSEMEATLMALESMNFSKRGASPSMHIVGAMIPFFNSQIQALNVLYKAMTGKLPFNERLKIQEKMLQRGAMLAVGTLAYAALMQDDEAYKNATPEQKYGNWFVRIPGVDEPVRIPVPFEIGYIFKALPEALYNSMVNEHGGEEATKAFRQILLQTIPGGSSYGLPQAIKPAIEAGLGKSFYTGRDILSAHEKQLLPEEQFRVNTSEAAKLLGKTTGTSPIMIENLVNGYTGAMGLAFLQAVSLGVPRGNTPEQAAKRLSELPLIGNAFQPNDAGGIINATYDRFSDAMKVQRTVDKMFEEGRQAEAKALLQQTGNEYAVGEVGDYFATQMKELTQYERAVQAMRLTPAEKRAKLDEIKQMKISLAATVRQQAEKIARR